MNFRVEKSRIKRDMKALSPNDVEKKSALEAELAYVKERQIRHIGNINARIRSKK